MKASDFLNAATRIHPRLIEIRRHLHMYPELSFQEKETSKYITHLLEELGISYTSGIAGTGIIAELPGKTSKIIGIRADMDALPIFEKNTHEYVSKNPGIMHACGHDVHMACALGALLLLREWELPHHIRFIFQPGEEKLPGGATLMIEEGAILGIEKMLALHVYPHLSAGQVGFKPGKYMASSDEIYIKVIGKGGHGALPHLNQDPVVAASQMVIALQQVVSRLAPPFVPSVLSFGKFMAEGSTNVIPDLVELEGTFRTMDESWRTKAHDLIRQIAQHTALAWGVRADVEIVKGYPTLINDEAFTNHCVGLAKELLGEEQVKTLEIRMTAEDFAFYSQQIPCCFFRLGTGSEEKNTLHSVHTPYFDVDEEALITGSALLSWLAYYA
ncbi:MAG: M20 family metallopeptidase [Flavobacteriales bacterium]|nr:M20 family metallopeptidase [Flavobacteriales bacterium]